MDVLLPVQHQDGQLDAPASFTATLADERSLALLDHARRVAPSDATVLIWGESATGKKSLARFIHGLSTRSRGPFRAVNCGASGAGELEHDMLGYERGAFRGAFTSAAGWFESASSGTLFLDEIQCLPLHLQARLMHILQSGEVARLGGRQLMRADVRLIAATNSDLTQAVAEGRFREDLYYLLKVVHLQTPALRERPGDILPLARHFIDRYCARLNFPYARLSSEAESLLLNHEWPGNIRELENAIQHALLIGQGGVLDTGCFILAKLDRSQSLHRDHPFGREALVSQLESVLGGLFDAMPGLVADLVDRSLISTAFRHCRHNQVKTAQLLGVSRNVLRGRLIQYGEIDAQK